MVVCIPGVQPLHQKDYVCHLGKAFRFQKLEAFVQQVLHTRRDSAATRCCAAGVESYDWFPVKVGARGSTSVVDFTRKSYAVTVEKHDTGNNTTSKQVKFLGAWLLQVVMYSVNTAQRWWFSFLVAAATVTL